ncbi:MAG TPA: hypothetical protein VGR07_11715 [Thermoanaerobaculia bacterium]|jgi:hypothetical protein|nr:hypothetical protein [Thermoanaerobaculia bacterium]
MSETNDYEDLRRYLLGQQPEEEEDRLELRLLREDDLFELAEAVEAELLDECARGELNPAECERLTHRLAASPGGRVRLAQARGLAAAIAGIHAGTAGAAVLPFRRPGILSRPALRVALAAGLAAGLAGLTVAVWQVNRKPQPSPPPPTIGQTVVPAPPPRMPAPAPAPPETQSAPPAATPPAHRPHRPLSTAVLQLAMTQTRSADTEPELRLAPRIRRAELRLSLNEGESYPSYEVAVSRAAGGTVWGPRRLPSPRSGSPLVIRLGASALADGSYEVTVKGVTGEGTTADVGFPRFRVMGR